MIRKALLPVSAFVLALAALSSCGRKNIVNYVSTTPIRQDLEVVYDVPTMSTSASAVFRNNDATGARTQLTNGNSITINGAVPNYEPLSYTYSWNDNGFQTVNFTLTKANGRTYTNSMNIGDTIGSYFPANMDFNISKANGLNFTALGYPFSASENLTVVLIGKDQFGNFATETKYYPNAAITLTRNDLASFKNGSINIQIKRQRTLGIQQSDSTGGGSRIVSLQVQKAFNLTN